MQKKKKNDREIWVKNISKKYDVSLGDLRISIKKGQNVNLLSPGFRFTEEQVLKSIESGSIYKKSDVIKVRKVAPVKRSYILDKAKNLEQIRPLRKQVDLGEVEHEELSLANDMTREEYMALQERQAVEEADMEFLDKAPALAVDPKFKKPFPEDE
jgi:hypothetical protein